MAEKMVYPTVDSSVGKKDSLKAALMVELLVSKRVHWKVANWVVLSVEC